MGEAAERVDALAGRLLEASIVPGAGHVVALHAGRGVEVARSMLAVLRAGGVAWVVDRELPDARIGALVAAARPALWIDLPGVGEPARTRGLR